MWWPLFYKTLAATFLFAALHLDLNSLQAQKLPKKIRAHNILTEKIEEISLRPVDKKATVVVFLSALCPCSKSHRDQLRQLSQKHTDINFVGVHSNIDEEKTQVVSYFKEAQHGFLILRDRNTGIADRFKVPKTPHAYVVSPQGQIVFQGGITDSSNAASATAFYLQDALEDVSAGRPVRLAEAKSIGCGLLRKSELVR
jgi:hypothetical protein